jgi:hypothetical protein
MPLCTLTLWRDLVVIRPRLCKPQLLPRIQGNALSQCHSKYLATDSRCSHRVFHQFAGLRFSRFTFFRFGVGGVVMALARILFRLLNN